MKSRNTSENIYELLSLTSRQRSTTANSHKNLRGTIHSESESGSDSNSNSKIMIRRWRRSDGDEETDEDEDRDEDDDNAYIR